MNKENQKFTSNLKILNQNITLITNSLLLKRFIEMGYACSLLRNRPKNSTVLVKIPRNIQEVISSILDLNGYIMRPLINKYWIFHAAAFSKNNKATIVLGDAGSGKSSFSLAAGLLGAKIISDEPVLIEKKSHNVAPYRYLLKVDRFCRNFSKWKFFSHFDHNSNRYIWKDHRARHDLNIFTTDNLEELAIKFKDKNVRLHNIIILEKKRFNPLMHTSRHLLNREENLFNCFGSLNKLLKNKKVIFMPQIMDTLRFENKAKQLLSQIFD